MDHADLPPPAPSAPARRVPQDPLHEWTSDVVHEWLRPFGLPDAVAAAVASRGGYWLFHATVGDLTAMGAQLHTASSIHTAVHSASTGV